ncbi:MAG: hypothetical protein RL140_84 [Actinomycetota bacterium]
MVLRKFVAVVAVSAGLVLGTAGCSITHNVPTLQEYAPSDGSQASFDGVKALNVIYLTKPALGEGALEVGAIIGTFVNTTNKDVTVRVEYTQDGSDATDVVLREDGAFEFQIPAGGTKEFGYKEVSEMQPVLLNEKGEVIKPGQLGKLTMGVLGGKQNVVMSVPALDGSLEQYSALVQNLGIAQGHVDE